MILKKGLHVLQAGVKELIAEGKSDILHLLAKKTVWYSRRKLLSNFNAALPNPSSNPKNIIFLESISGTDGAGFGDSTFNLPGLQDVANHLGEQIDVVTTPERKVIFNNQPYVNNVLTPHDLTVQKHKYDLVFTLMPSPSKYKVGWKLTGGKKVIIAKYREEYLANPDLNRARTMQQAFQKAFKYTSISPDDVPHIILSSTIQDRAAKERETRQSNFVVGISISYKDRLKHYKQFTLAIDLLAKAYPHIQFLILGGKHDESIPAHDNIKDYSNIFSYEETLALMEQCALVTGFDGGLLNGAIAVGTPTHVVFNVIPSHKIIPSTGKNISCLNVGCELSVSCSDSPRIKHDSGICQKNNTGEPQCLDELSFLTVYNSIAEKIDGHPKYYNVV